MPLFLTSRPPPSPGRRPAAIGQIETPPHPRTGRQDRAVPSQPRRRLKLAVRTLPLQPSASPRRGPSARSTAPALPVPIRLRLFPSAQGLLQIASACSHPPKSCSRSPCSHGLKEVSTLQCILIRGCCVQCFYFAEFDGGK